MHCWNPALCGLFLLASFTAVLTGAGDPQDPPATQPAGPSAEELATIVHEHFAKREQEGFSGVILVELNGEIVLERAYGFRDPIRGLPMRTSDVFDVGSLVKPITRAAILKLEAQGKLKTSDPIAKYFPEVPEDKRAITIDHVLTHHAGFPDTFGGDYQLVDRETLRRTLFEAPLIAPVGDEANYSNSGYSLLAMLIEDVGGRPYEEWIRDEILAPCRRGAVWLRHTLFPGGKAGRGHATQRRTFWQRAGSRLVR